MLRRSLARAVPALLVLLTGCTGPRAVVPASDADSGVGARAAASIKAGPMLGYATHRDVAVWVQTTAPAEVQIRYTPIEGPADTTLAPELSRPARAGTTAPIAATAEGDHIAEFTIAGLEPGVRYAYDVLLDGAAVAFDYPTEFQTQPLWEWRFDPPAFTVAVGSCSYTNDPYVRPGRPYGGDYRIFETIAGLDPDLMLWLGDNVYFREVDWWTEAGMRYRYSYARILPELQPLLATTNHYATWDDHDFGPNNADRSYVLKGEALDVFEDYWANLTYGLPGVPGVFTQFQWADADFFLLDDRYHRTPTDEPDWEDRQVLGDAQLEWLLEALTASYAPFKIVALGGQILNPIPIFETYVNVAPEERERLIAGIVARGIEGVVFLSGDRHHAELIRLQPEGFYPLYDFTSSPLTAGAATPRNELDNPARVEGTLVAGQRNFGTLTFAGPRTDRTLTMRTYDTDGALLWEYTLRANDLRLPDVD
jgi:alkaline phosphatase D